MAALFTRGSALTLALLEAVAACGGRTQTLESDVIDVGMSASAGQPPGSGGGSTSTAKGGASGSLGAPEPTDASSGAGAGPLVASCMRYCSALASSACKSQFDSGPNCVSSCSGGAVTLTAACMAAELTTLECLTPALTQPILNCSLWRDQVQMRCRDQLTSLQTCDEPPPPAPATCYSSGTGTAASCELTFTCSDGTSYSGSCLQRGGGLSKCSCTSSLGRSAGFNLQEGIGSACYDAAVACGASPNPAPIPK